MKFIDYLKEVNAEGREFDACVGDVDMPATYVGDDGLCLDNPYLHEKYGVLLNAEVEIIKPRKGEKEVCVIDNAPVDLGVSFFWAAAGQVNCKEYQKLFGEVSEMEENPYARKYGNEEYNCVDITEEFVSRYGEFFSGLLQKVELSFSIRSFDISRAQLDKWAKDTVDVFINEDISFNGEHLFLTLENGKVLVLYASEFGDIYTLK